MIAKQLVAAPPTMYRYADNKQLVIGHAPWWISDEALLAKNKKIEKQTFTEALRDFLQNISLHCYGKLVEPGRRFQERFLWLIFHAVALATLIIFLWNTYNNGSRLFSTTLYDALYPVTKVPFPAISICSINRISNASAMRYAEELNANDPLKRGVSYFYKKIFMLSYNYYSPGDHIDFEAGSDFQNFLDLYDTNDSEWFYNTLRRMKMLTPRCSNILLECRFAGKSINCSEEFVESLTSRGVCCTYNSVLRNSEKVGFKNRINGPDEGLILLLNASNADNFYKNSILDGFTVQYSWDITVSRLKAPIIWQCGFLIVLKYVMIYSHEDFPGVFSGSVVERLAQSGDDTRYYLNARIFETVSEARLWSPQARNCYFADEVLSEFGRAYTFNKCVTRCRVRSIWTLCGCQPFQMANVFPQVSGSVVYCTLQHSPCMKRYNFKWFNVITQRQHVSGLEHELEDALYCPSCLPPCSQVQYIVTTTDVPINACNIRPFSCTKYYSTHNGSDLSIMRVGFEKTHIRFYKQILFNSWFEVFSTIGGICGISTGFSLIAFFEILFFFTRQIWHACHDENSIEQHQNGKGRKRRRKRKKFEPQVLLILP